MRRQLPPLAIMAGLAAVGCAPALAQDFGLYAYDTTYTLAHEHPGRGSLTVRFAAAADYMEDRLTFGSFAPTRQSFQWTQSGQVRSSENLLLTMTGSSEKFIVVGAHFDTAGTGAVLQGVDDNASGAGVLTELAAHMSGMTLGTGIVFAGFGAEENGLRGSVAYVNQLTTEQRANIAGMINIDSLITGDFMYAHAGTNYLNNPALKSYWEAIHAIADEKGIDLRSNPGLNASYPIDTGCCSDAQPFQALDIPILWLESTNWDIGDLDGYTQTTNPLIQTGATWHSATRDQWEYLVNALGEDRIPDRLEAYSELLTTLLVRLTDADINASAADAGATSYQLAELVSQRSSGLWGMAIRSAEMRLSNRSVTTSTSGTTTSLSTSGAEEPRLRPILQVSGLYRPTGSSDSGVDHSTNLNLLLGLTYDVSSDLSLGVSLGYGRNEDSLINGGSVVSEGATLGLDLAYESGALWAIAGAHVGENSLNGTRQFTMLSGLGTVVAGGTFGMDTEATTRGAVIKAGYDLHSTDTMKAGIIGGLDYNYYDIDGFTETGTDRGSITYGAQDFESAELSIGGRVETLVALGATPIVLGAEASWVRELADGAPTSLTVTDELGNVQTAEYSHSDKSFGRVGVTAEFMIAPASTGWVSVGSRVGHSGGSQWGIGAGIGIRF